MKTLFRALGPALMACAALVPLAPSTAAAAPYSALYIFGDSLSDSGNNAATPQIGTNAFQVIANDFYVPTQTYGGGTYSNGPVWSTQFADMLGLSAAPSVLGGTNFAFGGATTSGGGVPSLVDQSALYLGVAPTPSVAGSALYVVAGGGNNVRATLNAVADAAAADPTQIPSIIGAAAAQYAQDVGLVVDRLQASGAQHIVVWNAPNIGLTPAALFASQFDPSVAPTATFIAQALNNALGLRLQGEAGVQGFDVFNLQASLPAGTFANLSNACGAPINAGVCPGDISQALYWDGIHPTTATHGILAERMAALAVAAPVPEASTWAMMLAGLALVAGFARRRRA